MLTREIANIPIDTSDNAYRIAIVLDVKHDDDDSESEPPTILLNVSYPEAYPDVAPNLDLSTPPNAPRHPLLDVAEDKTTLLAALDTTVEESLGMAMVFTLVSTLKDTAETLISERQNQAQQARNAEAAKVDEEENRKFHGTAVTRDSFLKWRSKFRQEMEDRETAEKEEKEAEERKKRGGKVGDEKKLTGKQLWERGLVGKVDEDEVEGEVEGVEDVVASTEKINIDD
jgi:hypothetical protein